MKSRAKLFLEKIKEDDNMLIGTEPGNAGSGDMPSDKDAQTADTQPTDNNTGAPDLKALMEYMCQPKGMNHILGEACKMMDRYMDEDDMDTFTPSDDNQRGDIAAAQDHLSNASAALANLDGAAGDASDDSQVDQDNLDAQM